jgi:23S rRNA (uracil1939-C5)-methyltransferase
MRKHDKPIQVLPELQITALSSDGRGIARLEGLVVFVEDALPGDVMDVRVTRKKSGYREAVPHRIVQESPMRIDAACAHFELCGGCTWQRITYADQLMHKEKTVIDALKRIGHLDLPLHQPILGAPEAFHYRNKLEFTFSATRWLTASEIADSERIDRRALGFHMPGRFDKVIPIDTCLLMDDLANQIRNRVRDWAMEADLSFYHPIQHVGLLRNLLLRRNRKGEWMVVISATEANDAVFKLLEQLKETFPQVVSLMYAVNTKRNDVWYDLEIQLYHGEAFLVEEMDDLRFRIGPKSFYQTNPEQAHVLYKKVRELAQLTGSEHVYDLYTGTGTIALFLASMARKVTGVEYVEAAVEDARLNASLNGISHAEFFAGDMKDVLVPGFFEGEGYPEVIITDPPRAGMHNAVCERIVESGAGRVVYVSCNPSTQARDLALMDTAYRVTAVQPVDMFPQTTHVENIVLLEKR